MITEGLITGMTIVVGIIVIALLAYLTVQIYMEEKPKQRASVEPENDTNTELT